MTSAFLTLMKGQGHTTRSKVTVVEVSAFSECFLFFCFFFFPFPINANMCTCHGYTFSQILYEDENNKINSACAYFHAPAKKLL